MNRTLRICLSMAFLTLVAKTVGTYGIFSMVRDAHDAATYEQLFRQGMAGDAARVLIRERGVGLAYATVTQHMQVIMLAVAAMAYAGAMNGSRRTAVLHCLLVMVAIPVDLPLGIAHLFHSQAGTAIGLPAEMTWSWIPRNPMAVMRRVAGVGAPDGLSFEGVLGTGLFFFMLVPGVIASAIVLIGLGAERAEEEPDSHFARSEAMT